MRAMKKTGSSMLAACALAGGLLSAGVINAPTAAADPQWYCMGGSQSSNGECPQSGSSSSSKSSSPSSSADSNDSSKSDKSPTAKQVCRAWETQGAQQFKQKDENLCRFVPGD